jgi:hypothetical protein
MFATNKNILTSFFSLFCLFCLLCGPLSAANFHAILVSATEDKTIGESCEADLEHMRKEVQQIALNTGLHLKETIFKVDKPEKMLLSLKMMNVKKNDVVMFFFTGHGYHSDLTGKTPWPSLNFDGYKGVELKEIIAILKKKKARLTLFLTNCCNKELPQYALPPHLVGSPLKAKASNKESYIALFLKTKGVLIATSSQKGEYSWALVGYKPGSLFVNAFVECMVQVNAHPTKDISWHEIIQLMDQNTQNMATSFGKVQHPYYQNDTVSLAP